MRKIITSHPFWKCICYQLEDNQLLNNNILKIYFCALHILENHIQSLLYILSCLESWCNLYLLWYHFHHLFFQILTDNMMIALVILNSMIPNSRWWGNKVIIQSSILKKIILMKSRRTEVILNSMINHKLHKMASSYQRVEDN